MWWKTEVEEEDEPQPPPGPLTVSVSVQSGMRSHAVADAHKCLKHARSAREPKQHGDVWSRISEQDTTMYQGVHQVVCLDRKHVMVHECVTADYNIRSGGEATAAPRLVRINTSSYL